MKTYHEHQAEKRFQTAINYETEVRQSSAKPSMTVPDQSLSIPEILRRFASGQSLSIGNQNLVYSGDVLVPELRGIDPVDLDRWKELNDDQISKLENELKTLEENQKKLDEEKTRQIAEREAALDKLIANGSQP